MTDTHHSIRVDDEVMAAIEREMRSVHETPNEVLRRLLLGTATTEGDGDRAARPTVRLTLRKPQASAPVDRVVRQRINKGDRESFVEEILRAEFGAGFKTHPPYVMMFESPEHLVYFQNFAAPGSANLWYRLKARPLRVLRATRKRAFICLTMRADRCAFILPMEMLDEKLGASGWSRTDVEVNVDAASFRWRELNWNLGPFRKCY